MFILPTAVSVAMFVLDDEFDEEDGAGLVCVILSEGLDGITATVALYTSDDTATSPSGNKRILRFMLSITLSFTGDYVALVISEVTFGPTATSGDSDCVEVSLVDDANIEVTEQFNVTVVATSDIVSIGTPSSAVYSIIDDDCK